MLDTGMRVISLAAGLPAAKSGLRKNDVVVSVNRHPVIDEFDFRFHTACDESRIVVKRGNGLVRLTIRRPSGIGLGVQFAQRSVRRCSNRCVFCFIDQMPPGLRRSLYVKDEDIGHSFTNGNYVTLSATPYDELERVAGLGLSPLFVSVHATQDDIRRKMLGNCKAYAIMDQLRFLARSGISFHTQIVVCPGYNDGAVLRSSIRDLLSLKQGLLSVAIVPVGLTKHRRRHPLRHVTAEIARSTVSLVEKFGENDARKHGGRKVFCADEFFICAKMPIPPRAYYQDYPQIGNGVGLVRQLLEEWKAVKRRLSRQRVWMQPEPESSDAQKRAQKRVMIITSESAAGFLAAIASDMNLIFPCVDTRVAVAKNEFFGSHVTVAGLLTGRDIMRTVRRMPGPWDWIIVPGIVFNQRGYTLDGYSASRIEKDLGMPVSSVDSLKILVSLPAFSI
jgi:putative radical SAM enzyme (TIGR03279 family)